MAKAVKNGLLYDTEKATELAAYEFSHVDDFHWERSTLYVTDNGRFFLCGSGGALSRWAKKTDKNMSFGQTDVIEPVEPEEAARYMEQWDGDPDEYAKYFDVEDA